MTSGICALHGRACPELDLLGRTDQPQTDRERWNAARCGSQAELLSQPSTAQTQLPLHQKAASLLASLPMYANRSLFLKQMSQYAH